MLDFEITDRMRKDWLLSHAGFLFGNFDTKLYYITTWVCEGEAGNKGGLAGMFISTGTSFDNCVDKFLTGDISPTED